MDHARVRQQIDSFWDSSVLPSLSDFIRIPALAPAYDENWQVNGYLQQAAELMASWAERQSIKGLHCEVVNLPGKTPLIYAEVAGEKPGNALFYGHLDKMPEFTGWSEGLSAWSPVLRDDKLYGRGAADDGYSFYSALSAIKSLQEQNIPHPRCVLLIEAYEEAGSCDFAAHLDHLEDRIGEPELIICLDTCTGNYDQLWCTTSLRGVITGNLKIKQLANGVHSGQAGGVLPCISRMLRQLLNRIDDVHTGGLLLDEFKVEVPEHRKAEAKRVADQLQHDIYTCLPLLEGGKPVNMQQLDELLLNRAWRSALSVTGVDGFPDVANAGNVVLPEITAHLSVRTPPVSNLSSCISELKRSLEADSPYGAQVTFEIEEAVSGWHAPKHPEWLAAAIEESSQIYYDQPALHVGEGGGIHFVPLISEKFPQANFLITGVLGPNSNAHGPDEFLHLPMVKKLTCCMAHVLSKM